MGTVYPSHETDASDSFMEGLRRKESPGAMNARTFYRPDRCHPVDTMAKSVVTLGLDNLLPPSSLVRTVLSFVRAITCRRSIYF